MSKKIAALVMDVDGVLTDGGFWWGPNGEEWKRFCFADVMGLSRARQAGLTLGLISGEVSPLIDRFAAKTRIAHIYQGIKDKAAALDSFAAATGIALADICFIGDDINDLPAFAIAGHSAAPANAQPPVRAAATIPLTQPGGHGAVRELVEIILSAAKPSEA